MYLLDKKADDLLSKVTFAQQVINGIETPDEVLTSYTEPLQSWITSLHNRIEQAKANFVMFAQASHFNQSESIKESRQRGLLLAILRDYEDIERRIRIGLDTFLPLIPLWNNQKQSKETKLHHELLKRFVSDIMQLAHVDEKIMTIVGESYACLPIEWEERKHVIFGAYSEIKNLPKSVLLAHEIGHVFYYRNEHEISSDVIPKVLRRLSDNRPSSVDQRDFEDARFVWARHWIPEFVADCFAVRTLGPAFLLQFMLIALNSQPNRPETTHPPSSLRIKFMIDTLRSLNLPQIDINNYQSLWDSYAHTVASPISVFYLDDEVVTTAFECISLTVIPTCIDKKWAEILQAREAIKKGVVPDQDLVSTICALAMDESGTDLTAITRKLLKRYSSNSNAS
ncbi:MAG: hypothetical protein QXL10_01995 [Candidatus Bathyarchaeia archaeon]